MAGLASIWLLGIKSFAILEAYKVVSLALYIIFWCRTSTPWFFFSPSPSRSPKTLTDFLLPKHAPTIYSLQLDDCPLLLLLLFSLKVSNLFFSKNLLPSSSPWGSPFYSGCLYGWSGESQEFWKSGWEQGWAKLTYLSFERLFLPSCLQFLACFSLLPLTPHRNFLSLQKFQSQFSITFAIPQRLNYSANLSPCRSKVKNHCSETVWWKSQQVGYSRMWLFLGEPGELLKKRKKRSEQILIKTNQWHLFSIGSRVDQLPCLLVRWWWAWRDSEHGDWQSHKIEGAWVSKSLWRRSFTQQIYEHMFYCVRPLRYGDCLLE